MGRKNRRNKKRSRGGPPPRGSQGGNPSRVALPRPMQGVDRKSFVLNDIVPIILPQPTNSTVYTVVLNNDVNGYTWDITDSSSTTVSAGSGFYGETTGQFATQSMMFTQYYTSKVEVDLILSSAGSTYSMSPLVQFVNPNGVSPFILGTGGFASLLSAPQNTNIRQPYSNHHHSIDYQRWLVSMTDRCWRKTISQPAVSMAREQYPTDNIGANENFVLPSMTSAFQVTVPEGRFAANSPGFVLALFKVRTTYVFSQRRTDINDIVADVRDRVVANAIPTVRYGPIKTGS